MFSWFSIKITNNKKIGEAPKIGEGGDDQHVIYFTWPYMDINNLKHFNLKYRDLSKEPFIKANNALDITRPQDHPTKQTNEDKRELAL